MGLSTVHDGSGDWRPYFGLRFDLFLPDDAAVSGEAVVTTVPTKQGSRKVAAEFRSAFGLAGRGWHTVTLPLRDFSYEKDRPSVWMVVKRLRLAAGYADRRDAALKIRNLHRPGPTAWPSPAPSGRARPRRAAWRSTRWSSPTAPRCPRRSTSRAGCADARS